MLKKIAWNYGDVFSIRLRENLYSLVQMKENQLMEFFDIRRENNAWDNVDLTKVPVLFCIFVAEKRLRPLFCDRIAPEHIIPNKRETQRIMLNAVFGNNGNHTLDLIKLTPEFSTIGADILKAGLKFDDDREAICHYELTGMVGDPAKLAERLTRYFDSGINWDTSKEFFKDVVRP